MNRPVLDEKAKGVYVITVTPFTDEGSLDLESTDRVIDFYLEKGADGLTVLGVMGEAPKLTAEESAQYVKRVLDRVKGRIPTIVGVSSPGYAAMKELSDRVMDLGAAGVMVGPAATVRTDDQAYSYYEMVAETLGGKTPFCVQDHPLAYSVQLPAPVLLKIFRNIPSAVMLKHEDYPGPGLAKLAALRAAKDARRISILAGNGGGLFLPEELSRGADGAMTGFGYPEMMVGVCKAHAAGDIERAHDLFDAYLPLARYEQQSAAGLAVRKYMLQKRGAIASAAIRKPGPKLSPADIADIDRLIARQEKRLRELG
ncbi:dihydrodipicolinate synthase family protein [Usitatibacter palustris]|uniref:L-2-keto-3-deoxyarabonate dehydratase n=1 Tax=Usitatibacter palustris TaxID=2732487 RepID=A0A6M4H6I5_9PROT|nr:dihydrodipicolinate synthase family protein [Usitatibacter palustris]QJR14034.1 L-2-keto-3-deoxyarabonate dehydratase [Usitatibacter palustris]